MQLRLNKEEKKQIMEQLKEMDEEAELTLEIVKRVNGRKSDK